MGDMLTQCESMLISTLNWSLGPRNRVQRMKTSLTVDLDKDEMALLEIIAQDEESLDKALTRIAKMAVRTYFAELNSAQFERLVGRAFTARGYDVKNIGGAGDKGIDLIAKYRNE